MNYNDFLKYVKSNILTYLPHLKEDTLVDINRINKNNSIELDGLNIRKPEENMCPTIYLNEYYQKYKQGKSLLWIMKDIAECYMGHVNYIEFDGEDIQNFAYVKERLIVRIVNFEKNKKILENAPYLKLNDLAITFRWLAHRDEIGIATALVSNHEIQIWQIGINELIEAALLNTPRIFPYKIQNMEDILLLEGEERTGNNPLYILTNTEGVNGATCICYEDVLKNFAIKHNCNFYILPSSIHEVILMKEDGAKTSKELYDMVKEANEQVVSPCDFLSDNVYYYDREMDQITLA